MSSPSPDFLDRARLLQLAGPKAFARGEEYFNDHRVRGIQASPDRATAKVSGNAKTYRPKLWVQRNELHHACTCPPGRDGVFCRHCVALGLAWIDAMQEPAEGEAAQEESAANPSGQPQPRPIDQETGIGREQLREYLLTLDKERLINLTLEATDFDDILHRRLLLEVMGVSQPGETGDRKSTASPQPDLDAYVHVLREAIECSDYVDYHAMGDYAQGVEEAIKPLAGLLARGHANAVMELSEYALIELERSSDMIDTGDGALNTVYDELQRLHLQASQQARPEPEAFAARLLDYELEGGLGVFNNAVHTYADVLGPAGVAAWRRLLAQEWNRLSHPAAGDGRRAAKASASAADPAGTNIDYRRFQLDALMERVARCEGDTRTLIDIKRRDLSSGHDFLGLAELYLADGSNEEAARWAENGLAAFPGDGAREGLRDLLADVYFRLDRPADALGLLWADFQRTGSQDDFARLREAVLARQNGEWPGWRERALAELRARPLAVAGPGGTPPDRSTLVETLLGEGMDAEALAEARAGGCRRDLWLRIAVRRESDHPAEALRIYQDQLAPTIARGSQGAFREAIALLTRIGTLLDRLGRAEDFGTIRAEVRKANHHKRGFLKLLDGIKTPPSGKRRPREDG